MGRKKATMQLIPNLSIRKSTFKKRKASLIKKARELSLLCGQKVYLSVSDGPDDPSPEFWPPTETAAAAQALSHAITSRQTEFQNLQRQVTSMQARLKDLETQNLNLEAEERIMMALPVGQYRLVEVESPDLAVKIDELLGKRMKEVQDRINSLLSGPETLSVAPEDLRIDYGDISISFDPFSAAFMQQEQNMQEDMPGLIDVAASSPARMSWGTSSDLAPIPEIQLEDSMDEEIAAILYPSHDDSMDEEIAAILYPFKDPDDF
ncbi:hypothetical protein LUZ61_000399 [Rhynchospora tenuis]|uniref:MADS-box domain-containing protein n=1 Tax=Rhynchospora tenuis TaxID=198213 RepID=A0AAD5ZEY6_9POAL|nr:hypothetical protein LUZ61_000399 [Rhynchospora tenuis]